MGRSFSNKTPAFFYFQKGEELFDAILRSVYKELHADHETGAADNK